MVRASLAPKVAAFLGLVALWACNRKATTPPSAPVGSAKDHAGHTDHTHAVLADGTLVDVYAPVAPNTSGILRSGHAGHTGANSYDENAPATVLITTRWGQGSGVIIDPKGLILTNYHVVAGGEREDFRIEVGVTTAKLNPDGSVQPGESLRAVALKVDPERDLALLRVLDSPGPLPTVPLAPADLPAPGRRVSAIGNAGVGLGWAVKYCNINAVGTLENAVSTIFVSQTKAVPEEQREALLKSRREAAQRAGLLIQTDCTVLPGDSGGPLVDEETHEIVGLNAAVRSSRKGGETLGSIAFHVHVKEIRDFLKSVPEDAVQVIPDPWAIIGQQAQLDDTDRDGEVDSLTIGGLCGVERLPCRAIFVDMDQDSFDGNAELPTLQALFKARGLDAEWVLFLRPRRPRDRVAGDDVAPVADRMFYFDADNDGAFDRLVVVDVEKKEKRAYRIGAGVAIRDKSLDGLLDQPGELFTRVADRERFAHFRATTEHGTHTTRLEHTTALNVALLDLDRDGRKDAARVETRVDSRILLDLDQNALPDLDPPAVIKALASKMIDAEIVAIASTPYRVYYDTNDDDRFDLVLEGSTAEHGYALTAATIDANDKATPAPQHVGRRLLRADLVGTEALAQAAETMLGAAFTQAYGRAGDPLSSFPRPGPVGPQFNVRKHEDAVGAIVVDEPGRKILMVDLDRNTNKKRANRGRSLKEIVVAGAFDAEFVFVFDGTLAWSFYDGDNDGTFDQVWVASGNSPAIARHVFEVGAKVVRKDPADKASMFEASVFRSRKLRQAFGRVRARVLVDPAAQ